jgi:two-component system, chemotaxis family, chemotaxis protein CheY
MMDFTKLRILIVDDQQESRFFLRSVLSDLGVNQVFEAKDGRGALEFMDYGQDLVDIIFCDWNMPALPGIFKTDPGGGD